MKAITHLAGNAIVLGDRVIQRCFICGMKLCDNLGAAAPLNEDGSKPTFPVFEVGAWIEVDGDNPTSFVVVGQSERPQMSHDEIPDHCCLELVE